MFADLTGFFDCWLWFSPGLKQSTGFWLAWNPSTENSAGAHARAGLFTGHAGCFHSHLAFTFCLLLQLKVPNLLSTGSLFPKLPCRKTQGNPFCSWLSFYQVSRLLSISFSHSFRALPAVVHSWPPPLQPAALFNFQIIFLKNHTSLMFNN